MSLLARLRAEDPGYRRIRFAARCTLSLVLAMVGGALAAKGRGPESVVATVAGALALFASMMMQDPRKKVVLFMAAAMLPVTLLGTVGAALLAPHPEAGQAGLLLVLVGATWMQRFGPLGTALGITAFASWFYALLSGAQPSHWPWLAVACGAALASALAVRLLILPESPARDRERLVQAFTARMARLLEALGQGGSEDLLVQRQAELDETALALERCLHLPGAGADAEALSRRVFRTELAVEEVLRAYRTADPGHRKAVEDTARAWAVDLLAGRVPAEGAVLGALGAALRDEGAPAHGEPGPTSPPPPPPPPPQKGTALQMLAAGALAILAGTLLSAKDWQFAVFAAWLVVGDSTMGTVRNVLDRVLGTALGLLVGAGLGHVLSGRSLLEVVLILLCVFVALWFMQVSQRITVFLFAVMLSVLLGLSGTLTTQVLWTRLEETTVGALAGGLVAALLLPRRLRPLIDGAIADFLERVEALLAGEGSIREMDAAYHRLRSAARPGLAGIAGAVPETLRRDMLALSSLRDAARRIATRTAPPAPEALDPVLREAASLREWLRGGPAAEDQEVHIRGEGLARLDAALWGLAEG